MSDEYAIKREDTPSRGRYVIRLGGELEAELTFRKLDGTAIAIDHTYTPPPFRGRKVAFALMRRAIDDAKRDGIKVRPECSYAVTQFRRHPEWADLLA